MPRCIQEANTLVQDLPQCIEEIAKHMGIPLDPELKAIAAEQASLRCMLQHASKYDEHMLKINRNSICGLPPAAGLSGNQVRTAVLPFLYLHPCTAQRTILSYAGCHFCSRVLSLKGSVSAIGNSVEAFLRSRGIA